MRRDETASFGPFVLLGFPFTVFDHVASVVDVVLQTHTDAAYIAERATGGFIQQGIHIPTIKKEVKGALLKQYWLSFIVEPPTCEYNLWRGGVGDAYFRCSGLGKIVHKERGVPYQDIIYSESNLYG